MVESDHWSLGGNKVSTIYYKLLNNSGYDLTRLNVSLVWRDGAGDEETALAILENPLPYDEPSKTVRTQPIYGHCADIKFIGFRNVLHCEAGPLSGEACEKRLRLIYTGKAAKR